MITVYISQSPYVQTGQLGQAAGTRRITITGNFTYNPPVFATVNGTKDYLRNQIIAQGWTIYNFDLPIQTGFIDLTAVAGAINLTVDVPSQFTNDQHLNQLYSLLNSYNVSNGISAARPFSNVFLKWTGEEKPDYTPPKTTTGSGTPTPTPIPTNNGGGANNPYVPTTPGAAPDLLGMIGLGGVSVGTITVVLIAVALFRRR